jgi:actin, other eukaryote
LYHNSSSFSLVRSSYALPHAVQRLELAGGAVTEHMARIFTERGHSFTSSAEREIVRDIKEQLGYVALNYESELQGVQAERDYRLPDGEVISLGAERFRCAEMLFRPSLAGSADAGLHEAVYNTVVKCDVDQHKALLENITVSGERDDDGSC